MNEAKKGFDFSWAETMMNHLEDEQRRSLFGSEEKNFACNYAFHVGETDEAKTLIEKLAAARFEIQHGFLNPQVRDKIQPEIDRIDADWFTAPENPLKAAEMATEQNLNQIDGIINNEPPRVNQGYTIIENEIVGHREFVLAESPTAPQSYVTWARNIQNDEQMGGENFFWGHYFNDQEAARKDFHTRADEEREDQHQHPPSLLENLKRHKQEAALTGKEPKPLNRPRLEPEK